MRNFSSLTLLVSVHQFCLLTAVGAKSIEEKIHLRLYKNITNYEKSPIYKGETLFEESKGYNRSLPLVLIIHGIANGADSNFVNGLFYAFTKRKLTDDYNIFAVDMPELFENSLRNQFYIGILASVQPAGKLIGHLFSKVIELNLTTPESINIIGYSMGAQVAGYAARAVKKKFGKINFIAGLDPAGPGFHTWWAGKHPLTHVSSADALTTHFYHTNSISCGTRDRVGTADFVFNSGKVQPGCTRDAGLDCSHVRVPLLYIEAVANPKSFVARKCSSWEEFKTCDCNNHETLFITFPPDSRAKGIYYLRTHAKKPFALGKKGSRCRKIVHEPHVKDELEETKLRVVPIHSDMSMKIENIKESIPPQHNLKDNINMQLNNGIREMEDLHHTEANEHQDVEVVNESTRVRDDLNRSSENKSHIVSTDNIQVFGINP